MTSSFGATNVVVAVRARPFTPQELEKDSSNQVTLSMDSGNTTTLHDYATGTKKKFTFDYNYWSLGDPHSSKFAPQEKIFADLGAPQLDHALRGYNACVFAYGQTSSGKTHTMMGPPSTTDHSVITPATGLIPRMCQSLFERIHLEEQKSDFISYRVEMSFSEIYNEKVYCLLDPSTNNTLRPREDPKAGPYVENLTSVEVSHYRHISELLKMGNRERHTSKTRMNERSSRSHAVFCLTITKSEWHQDNGGDATELISRVNLVDLAGSERTNKAGTDGDTLKEGININKSLTSLGMVIKKLADLNDPGVTPDGAYVPYRDSTLTWLLKDNLGGNSRTVMMATLSPCRYNYEETLTTLRYAERVKLIKNAPSVNKRGSSRKIIRELRQQIRQLNEQLAHFTGSGAGKTPVLLRNLMGSSQFFARILSSLMPPSVWAGYPFLLQSTAKDDEPFVFFLREGYSVVTGGIASYSELRDREAEGSAVQAMIRNQMGARGEESEQQMARVRRRSSVTFEKDTKDRSEGAPPRGGGRRPSFMQATFASAFKDTGVAGQLRESAGYDDHLSLSRDPAHQLGEAAAAAPAGHDAAQVVPCVTTPPASAAPSKEKRMRRIGSDRGMGGRRRSSSVGSLRRRDSSVLGALEKANRKIERDERERPVDTESPVDATAFGENVQDSDGEDADDDAGKYTPPSSFTKRNRMSSTLGVSLVDIQQRSSSARGARHFLSNPTPDDPRIERTMQGMWESYQGGEEEKNNFFARPDLGIDTDTGLLLASSTIRLAGLGDEEGEEEQQGPLGAHAMFLLNKRVQGRKRQNSTTSFDSPPPAEEAEEGQEGPLLLPIGPTYANGQLLPSGVPFPLPAKCTLKFGGHATFTFVNPFAPGLDAGGVDAALRILTSSPAREGRGAAAGGGVGGSGLSGSGSGLGVSAGEMESPSTAGLHDAMSTMQSMAFGSVGNSTPGVGHLGRGADGQTDSHLASPLEARGMPSGLYPGSSGSGTPGCVTLDRHSGSQIDPSKAGMYRHLTETERMDILLKRDRELDEKSQHIAMLHAKMSELEGRLSGQAAGAAGAGTGGGLLGSGVGGGVGAAGGGGGGGVGGVGGHVGSGGPGVALGSTEQATSASMSQVLEKTARLEQSVKEHETTRSRLEHENKILRAALQHVMPGVELQDLESLTSTPRVAWHGSSGGGSVPPSSSSASGQPVNEVHMHITKDGTIASGSQERGSYGDTDDEDLGLSAHAKAAIESARRADLESQSASRTDRAEGRDPSMAAYQSLIQSKVNDKYRQLDILRAQIGDKRHAARQLQDSYNERLADLEREAWEKHRIIRELAAEEQDMVDRLAQLRSEEGKLQAKITKHRRSREDMMDSKELNTVEGYEFVGGLRLDDAMFRSKGIQLSRQSRTPVLLRFTPTALLVFNADHHKHTAFQFQYPSTGLAARNKVDQPLKEAPYDRILSVRQIDKCILEVVSQGFTSNLSLLCDNREKRNSIQKLLMLKTKGVILSLGHWTVSGQEEDESRATSPMRQPSSPVTDVYPSAGATSQMSLSQRSGIMRSGQNGRVAQRGRSPPAPATANANNGASNTYPRALSSRR